MKWLCQQTSKLIQKGILYHDFSFRKEENEAQKGAKMANHQVI